MDLNKTKEIENLNDDTTKYGEFVSSYFTWLTLEKQKDKASKMEKITKKEGIPNDK